MNNVQKKTKKTVKTKAEKVFYNALNSLDLYQVALTKGKYTVKHLFYLNSQLIQSKSKGIVFTCDTLEQLNKLWGKGWVICPKNPGDPDSILEYRF